MEVTNLGFFILASICGVVLAQESSQQGSNPISIGNVPSAKQNGLSSNGNANVKISGAPSSFSDEGLSNLQKGSFSQMSYQPGQNNDPHQPNFGGFQKQFAGSSNQFPEQMLPLSKMEHQYQPQNGQYIQMQSNEVGGNPFSGSFHNGPPPSSWSSQYSGMMSGPQGVLFGGSQGRLGGSQAAGFGDPQRAGMVETQGAGFIGSQESGLGSPQGIGLGVSQGQEFGGSKGAGFTGVQRPEFGGQQAPGNGGLQGPVFGGPHGPRFGGPPRPGLGPPKEAGVRGIQRPEFGGQQASGNGSLQGPGFGGPRGPGIGGPPRTGFGPPKKEGLEGVQRAEFGDQQALGNDGLQGPGFGGLHGPGSGGPPGHHHMDDAHPFRAGSPMSVGTGPSTNFMTSSGGGMMPSLLYLTTPGFLIPSTPMIMQHPGYNLQGQYPQLNGQSYPNGGFKGQFQRPGQMNGMLGSMQGGMLGGQYYQRPNEGSAGFNSMQMMLPGSQYGFQGPNRQRPIMNSDAAVGSDNGSQSGQFIPGGGAKNGQSSVYYLYQNGGGNDQNGSVESESKPSNALTEMLIQGSSNSKSNGNAVKSPSIKVTSPSEGSKNILSDTLTAGINNEQLPSNDIQVENKSSSVMSDTGKLLENSQNLDKQSGATGRDGIPDDINLSTNSAQVTNEQGSLGKGVNIAAKPSIVQGSQTSAGSMGKADMLAGSESQSGIGAGISEKGGSGAGQMQSGGGKWKGNQIKLITLPAQNQQTIKLQTVGGPAASKTIGQGGSNLQSGMSNSIKLITIPSKGQNIEALSSQGGANQQMIQTNSGGGGYNNMKMMPAMGMQTSNGRLSKYIYPNSFIVTPIKTKLPRPEAMMDENFSLEDVNSEASNGKSNLEMVPNKSKMSASLGSEDTLRFPK